MNNSLKHKPHYTKHRTVAAADGSVLSALETKAGRGAVNAVGYNSLQGFVKLTGGTTPTVSLIPLERVTYHDAGGNEVHEFWLVRVSAITGSPTAVDVFLAGGLRANEGSI